MKNYELIAELSKFPAGHEIVFNAIVADKNITSIGDEMSQVIKEIEEVDVEGETINLF